jgi:hypothetical protein
MEEPPDPEFARMIPDSLEVIRVKALLPQRTRKFGLGDLGIRCFPYMLQELSSLCRKRRIDALFIPGPPWHTFCLGPIIRRRFGIPYVMDYIDPWVTPGPFHPWKKAFWFRLSAYLLEPLALREVDGITAVSAGTVDTLKKRMPHLKFKNSHEIPYGFEPADFDRTPERKPHPYWNTGNGKLHFCYIGVVWPQALGTVKALLDALALLKMRRNDLFERLEVHFFGTTYNPQAVPRQVVPLALERGLRNVTEDPCRIPYLDAISVLKSAGAILALGSSDPHYTASKIFPNLLAQRPLLAIFHEQSSVVEILRVVNAGTLVTYSTVEPVETRVEAIYEALIKMVHGDECNRDRGFMDRFEAYSARSMTRRLAGALDDAVEAK